MSPLEQHVTRAVGDAQPGAAIDFGVIMQLMSMILQFIQQCPFGNAKRSIREGALEAKVAAYRAVKASGYDGNPVDLTNALIEQGRRASDDELDATIASAYALQPGLKLIGALLCASLTLHSLASAGPFPQQPNDGGGPFPPAFFGRSHNGTVSVASDRHAEEFPALRGGTPSTAPLNPESRIPNPPPPPLRDRIAAYRSGGGGIVGVRGMTITTHMLRDHGWRADQLAGLSADELYLLHGMQHAGRIEPQDVATTKSAATPRDDGYPVQHADGKAVWYVNGERWTTLGGGAPVEGQVYTGRNRSFVFRNGRMHAASANIPARRCADGQCRLR